MFGAQAERLRDMGWSSIIPLRPGLKAPAIAGWERFSEAPPTDEQVAAWSHQFAGGGIGLAFGPDRVIGVDLDYLDAVKATEARSITERVLGPTPVIRIGRSPKSMHFYRASAPITVPRAFGGFELYTRSGQVVLYGTHPDTGKPYTWPEESPEDLSPEDLPPTSQRDLERFIDAMAPLREDRVVIRGKTVTNTGQTATWLKVFAGLPTHAEMIGAAVHAVASSTPGGRHYTMTATVTALVTRGISSVEFRDRIALAYTATLDDRERRKRAGAVDAAILWASTKIWGSMLDAAPITLASSW